MYKVKNEYIINVGHWGECPWNYHKYFIEYLHSEKELIEYLAKGYHFNSFFEVLTPLSVYS